MECLEMITVKHDGVAHKVPCGKCAFCLTNKRSGWMFRIHHEMKNQLHKGYFLTLTYDERHVKRVGPEGRLSLRFRDVQLYLKRIRKAKYYAKYICVGEYGGETKRPHYHMLLWTDAPVAFLENNWKSSSDGTVMGRIHFGKLTIASAMYCLKYIIQPKQIRETGLDPEGNGWEIEKTRAQFSKGLGLCYLTTEVYNYHTRDYEDPKMFSVIDGRKVALPRYYKQKIFTKHQMRREQEKTKWDSIRKYRQKMREAIAHGVKDTASYFRHVRREQCRQILLTTKYNLTI